ncbi:MAG: acyl-CoA thioesterase [Alphaproteobacteria bacterium]
MNDSDGQLPHPAIRVAAMPSDANPSGDIFGGWILGQMDIAGGIIAALKAKGRVVTVGVEAMSFHLPVFIGDLVSCYGDVERIGRTSISIRVETWVRRREGGERVKVTEGVFTYVALDSRRKPRLIKADDD